ncbi:hypothetical protein NUSPORA_02373 [Nucleospora cyclopteri]
MRFICVVKLFCCLKLIQLIFYEPSFLPLQMITKTIWLLNVLGSQYPQKYMNIKNAEIYSKFENNILFKNYLPKFYNFESTINTEKILLHFKNIINKTLDLQIIDFAISEYQTDPNIFKEKIISIKQNFKIIKFCLYKSTKVNSIFQKIELKLLAFLYHKIELTAQLNYNQKIINDVLQLDVSCIIILIQNMVDLRNYLNMQITSGIFRKENIIIITQILDFIHHIKNNLNNEIDVNFIVTKLYKEYFDNHTQEETKKNDEYNHQKDFTIQHVQNFTKIKIFELEQILKETNIDFNCSNMVDNTKIKLYQIVDILYTIFQKDNYVLKIDCFLDVFLFCNFLRDKIIFHIYFLKNNIEVEKSLSINCILEFSEFSKALESLDYQKNLLGNLISGLGSNMNIKILRTARFKFFRNKYAILKHYIIIESFYNYMLNITLFEHYFKHQHSFNIKNHFKILNHLKNNHSLSQELFDNDFKFFKIICILTLKLSSLYLLGCGSYKLKYHTLLYELISEFTYKIGCFVYIKETIENQMKEKQLFIKFVMDKFAEHIKLLKNIKFGKRSKSLEHDVKKNFLDDLNLQISLYEIFYYYIDTNATKLSESRDFNRAQTSIKNLFKISECVKTNFKSDSFENNTKKYVKPKKFWAKNWEMFENKTSQNSNSYLDGSKS